jgi:c-di-GMP-binding flagellar brake protein YcgR
MSRSTDDLTDEPSKPVQSAKSTNERFPFEAMNLKVGDRLQAQPPAQLSAERCNVRLIGYAQDLSMLVTTPTLSNGVRLDLLERDQLVLRVFSSQNAFAFSSDVQRVCKLPYAYLHLSFPKEVQGTVIRKAHRIRIKIICNVRPDKEGANAVPGVLSNLSANGALLDGRRNMAELGDTLRVAFHMILHKVKVELALVAKVRAISGDEAADKVDSPLAHFGLEFIDLQPNDQMLLQSIVYQQMVERPQSLV